MPRPTNRTGPSDWHLGKGTNTQRTKTVTLRNPVTGLQTTFNTNANGHVNYRTEISPPATLNTTTYSTNADCGYVLTLLKLQLWAPQRKVFAASYPFPNLNLANERYTWLQYHFALTCRM